MRTLLLAILLSGTLASADPRATPNWTVGAGLGFTWSPVSSLSGVSGISGLSGLAGLSSLGLMGGVQPSVSALIERRLSAHTFLLFQLSGGYGSWQSTTDANSSSRQFSVDGQLGVRHVFNPHGLIEVSWFGSARTGYLSIDAQVSTQSLDPNTGMLAPDLLALHGRAFSVGAATGLVLERELVEGLALRFSSSVLGLGFSTSSFEMVGNFVAPQPNGGRSFDVGLRFSPTLELRYAF